MTHEMRADMSAEMSADMSVELTRYPTRHPTRSVALWCTLCALLVVGLAGGVISPAEAKRKRRAKRVRASLELNIDLKGLRNEGKTLYNKGEYREATSVFLQVVQHSTRRAQDYIFLAWSASQSSDFEIASIAYQIYFELKKNRRDEHWEPYQEVNNNIDLKLVKRMRTRYQDRVKALSKRIKRGEIKRQPDLVKALLKLHRDRVIDPLLGRLYSEFAQTLQRDLQSLIKAAVSESERPRVLQETLKISRKLFKRWGESTWGNSARADQALEVLQLLEALLKTPKDRAERLLALSQHPLAEISPETLQLASAQGVLRRNDAVELYMLSDGLINGLSMQLDNLSSLQRAQLLYAHLLRAVYGAQTQDENQRERALDSMIRGLELSQDRARAALGLK